MLKSLKKNNFQLVNAHLWENVVITYNKHIHKLLI